MKYTWQAIRNARIVSNGQTPDAAAQYATNNIINTLGYNPYNVVNPIDDKGNVVANAKLLWDTDWERELINNSALKQEHRLNISGVVRIQPIL